MKQSDLMRWGGYLGGLGAIVLIIGALIHPTVETPEVMVTSKWIWAHLILSNGILLSILGLGGIYLKMSEKAGKLGLLGFLLAFAGLAGMLFLVYTAALIEPVVAKEAPQLLDPNGPLQSGLFGTFIAGAMICHVLGFLLLGIAVWQTNSMKWLGGALILGSVPLLYYFVNQEASERVFLMALIVLAVGLFGLNRQVWMAED
jgi:hypothetical protein